MLSEKGKGIILSVTN